MLVEARAHMARTKIVRFSETDPSAQTPRILSFKEFREDRLLIVLDAAVAETREPAAATER